MKRFSLDSLASYQGTPSANTQTNLENNKRYKWLPTVAKCLVLVTIALFFATKAVLPATALPNPSAIAAAKAPSAFAAGTIHYVDSAATGANNGSSWTNAYTNLQSAIAAAISGDSIFVAKGTYKPDGAAPGNRSLSFNMKTGVTLIGGFPTGGSTLASRNWTTNPTILSGDIGTTGVNTDNSYHVVRCNSQQGELNGFIVEKGRADGAAPDNDGGGAFITSGYLASNFCTYRNNFATDQGGGTYHDAGGNPQYKQCKFESNTAAFGGGSYAFAATFITNCAYIGNTATTNGGGIYAVVNINMYNLTLRGNSATTSGNAIYYQSGGSNRLFNSIVWGNTGSATHIAGAGSITLRSSIIEGGCPGGGATCTSILNTNPMYADAAGRLSANSPAIDTGDNATGDANSDNLTIDLDNLNRNFDAIPGGTTRDMGAFESQSLNLSRYYVDHTATGSNNGASWANAFTDFQSAVAAAGTGDTVLVAAGTHKPNLGPSRLKKFTIVEGVRYYGGFPNGGGTFAQRNFATNRTILSGDIGTPIDSTDNCFVVVDANNLTPATLMSGFTVEEGNADSTAGFGHPYNRAGGIHLGTTGSIRLDSVTVRNNFGKGGSGIYAEGPANPLVLRGCTFDNNSNASAIYIGGNATGSFTDCIFNNNQGFNGGALSLNVLSATISFTNCTFTANKASASGGGGAINGGIAACTFTNCTFANNIATTGPGGALYKFYATVNTFTNCTFTGNKAFGGGGALYGQGGFNLYRCTFRQNLVTGNNQHGGAVYNNGTPSIAENCLFWDNRTTIGIGGAIYNNTGGTFTIKNSTFALNHALGFTQGGGINNNSNSNATIGNCIFWGNLANNSDVAANTEIGHGTGTLTVTNTIWQGQTPSGTIYNTNPLFTNAATGDLTLTLCSPAIDTGSTAGMPVVDLTGAPRPFNARPGTLDYDLGAYEFQSSAVDVTPPNAICQNLTLILNGGGTASTSAAAVNNGSTDNCAITSTVLSQTAFSCANVGANTVTLTLSDAAANTSTCTTTITVQDLMPPTALCQNLTINLDALGSATISPAMANNGSTDNCAIGTTAVSTTTVNCSNTNTAKLFITDADRIFKTNLSGNNRINLIPAAAALYTIAVVPSKDSVYIANFNAGKLQRVHLNGGTITDIKTGVQPFGIAVDHIAGKIYWSDPNANTISRCNMDGSGTQIIVSGSSESDYSRIIKLDLANGKMYWTDANLGTIKRANLDGTSIQTIVTSQGNIVGLDLDVPNNKLYFSSYSFSQIKRTNLDGSGLTVIVASAGSVPLGLALDPIQAKIYWVNGTGGNTLKRCDINGSNIVTLQSGMNLPYDIGIIPAMPVTLTVTDVNANTSTCTSYVVVQDLIAPAITCPSNITGTNDPGLCSKAVSYATPVGTDNCPATTIQTTGLASGAAFPIGTTTNTFIATDNSGNSTSCAFTLTITDNEGPAITCPANITTGNGVGTLLASYPLQSNLLDATSTFSAMSLIGNPNPPTPPTPGNGVCINGIPSTFPNGQSTQTPNIGSLNATNFSIKVDFKLAAYPGTSTGAPVIVGGSSWRWIGIWVSQTGLAGVQYNNSNRVYSATSLSLNTWYAAELRYSSNTVHLYIDHVEVFSSVIGPLTTNGNLNFTTNHAGNGTALNGCIQNLQIMNGTTPNCGATVHYTTPVGTDNCPGATTVRTSGLASGATFPIGTTTNVFQVTDASGATATCTSTVTVLDTDLPTIACPSNITTASDPGLCDKVVTYTAPVGADNCPAATTTQTVGQASGANFPVGTTTNTFQVTDAVGNTSTCSFTVTITDTELPAITCPSNITGNNDLGQCSKAVTFTAPVGADNCPSAATTQTSGLASGAAFPVGTTTNTFRVTDASGNTATCSFTVTITDTELPTITCPSNITGNNDLGQCSKAVTFTAPTGADNCPAATTTQTAGLASGAAFPVGTTTNTFRVTDAAGSTSTCSFTVTITDTQAPTITCPSNVTGNNDPGLCSKVVTYTAPVGADNCPSATTTQTAGLASGASFPVGTTTNTFRVTDAAGNTSTCSFTITITDAQVPTITCPGNITGNNDPGLCSKVVTFTAPTGADNCPAATTTQTAGLTSGASFPVGTTTNTFRVTDAAGNTSTCSFTITITDAQAPTITCTGNVTGINDPGLCSKVVTFTAPTGTDNCPSATTAQTAGLASGSSFPVGTITNTFRVTDATGNTSTCAFTVTITDNQAPTITCPSNITGTNDSGLCSKAVTYTAPTGTDNCPAATTTQTAGLASGASFPVGTTTNTFRVTDAAGNTSTCSFTVTITDTELPTISCPSNISGNNDPGLCSKVVTYTVPVGADNCPSATTTQTAGLASGAAFQVGATTNTFRVTDAAGNTATCSFTVTITDNEAPTITCPGNITSNNDPGLCSKAVTYTPPTGTDNCPSATTTQTAGLASGASFPVGTTTNTFRVTDAAGNTSTCAFTVTITDSEAPTITCPGNITGTNDLGLCSKAVTYTPPTGTDNCPSTTTTQTGGLNSNSNFPVGTTTNTFQVTDAAGNTSTCAFTVTITDAEAPTITCPGNITGTNDLGQCSKVVTYTPPTGNDNCPSATTAQTGGLSSTSNFSVGMTTNTFRVTDATGNTSSCSFTVTITDTEAPTITCPGNITGTNDLGQCAKVVTYTPPTGTDNCPSATTAQTGGMNSNSNFPVGTTTNTFQVTDAAGNTSTCTFDVTITDAEAPTITCPGNITGTNDLGLCSAQVAFTDPTGTDNCPAATTTQTGGLNTNSNFPIGTTSNTFQVTDAAGNTTTCTFTINITDTEAPTITCPSNITTSNDSSLCTAQVTFTDPTGTDNCPAATTAQTGGLSSNSNFPVGTTTNTFTVTDAAGNTTTCTFDITVTDAEAPAITCPSNITTNNDPGLCSAQVTFTDPTGTDNCPAATTTQTGGLSSNSNFPVGTTTNTFQVTDAAGNTATCTFDITILESEAPIWTGCPPSTTLPADSATCTAIHAWSPPTATDNCLVDSSSATHTPGTSFPLGTTTVTYWASDEAGNTAICTFDVTVNPTTLTAQTQSAQSGCYNITCNGASTGTAMVTPAGGCLPYTYLWSNGATTDTATGLPAGNHQVTVTDANGATTTLAILLTEPSPLLANLTGDTILCIGDSSAAIDLIPTGGNDCGTYHYAWSTGDTTQDLSGLPAGTYALTLSDDGGCTTTATWQVQNAIPITFDLGPDTAMCPGGPFTLLGPAGYAQYLWSNGNTNQNAPITQPGTYGLQVTSALGCYGNDTITVGEFTLDNNLITTVGSTTLCIDDTLTLVTSSGLTDHQWNTGATTPNLYVVNAGGYFWLTANDNHGCTVRDSAFAVFHPFAGPNPQIIPGPSVFLCAGDSAILNAQGGYASYLWSTGATTQRITVANAGTYQVEVWNGFGCTGTSAPVNVTTAPASQPAVTYASGILSTTTFSAYQWLLGGNAIFGAVFSTYTPVQSGWYQVAITDVHGCNATSDSIFVNLVGAPDPSQTLSGIQLYPNPSGGMIHLRAANPITESLTIEIFDMFGKQVTTLQLPNLVAEANLDLSTLAKAPYSVRITTHRTQNTPATFRIIIQ